MILLIETYSAESPFGQTAEEKQIRYADMESPFPDHFPFLKLILSSF